MIEHRRVGSCASAEHLLVSFERDRLTVRYQVQEMLRTERIFEPAGITAELEAYNPLTPDGLNLKATLGSRTRSRCSARSRLAQLRSGFERHCWMRVRLQLRQPNEVKTSAVHFLRWEFTAPMIAAARSGAALVAGVDHPHYKCSVEPIAPGLREALLADFDPPGGLILSARRQLELLVNPAGHAAGHDLDREAQPASFASRAAPLQGGPAQ